ncbi:MAG: helix-turn-helix domain-containing protein [Thermoplasmata archaeon]|nr:helix-turn-helix domain-containing protein [Thermoplasmata archaeon]
MGQNYIFKSASISCKDAISCFFNLNALEVNTYNTLVRLGPMTNKQLAEELDRDRSTVYRALHKLMACGLVFEDEKIGRGGNTGNYVPVPPLEIKKEVEKRLENWVAKINDSLGELETLNEQYEKMNKDD